MKISIVIGTAPDRNAEVLESLKKVDYGRERYEVIVVKGLNPSENRNNGVKKAKGEIIGFIDDDAFVDKNILKNAELFFERHKEISLIGGPQLTPKEDRTFARVSGYALESYFGTSSMSKRYRIGKLDLNADENSLTSANCFVRKDVFKKINGFNVNLYPGEDPEFFARAKKNGFRTAYVPNVIIYHKRRATLPKFMEQFFKYGYFRLKKEKFMGTNPGILFFLPSFFVLYMVLMPFFSMVNYIFLFPFLVYAVISLFASIFTAFKKLDFLALFA